MIGVEIDFVVADTLKALALYEKIFDVEPLEVTNFSRGQNEVVFNLYGTRFHMLDENPEFHLLAPTSENPNTMWFNVMVPDIEETYSKAMESGCSEIQPVTEIPDFGASNAMFLDPYGYIWMLHQVDEEVSFEERNKIWEDKLNSQE